MKERFNVLWVIVFNVLCFLISTNAKARTEASLIMNGSSGEVLHSNNHRTVIYPASLTKMATLYMAFDMIKKGHLSLYEKLYVSKTAAGAEPRKLGLLHGQTINTRDAIMSLIVVSANDAAVVLAERIGGTEANFANMMTKKMHRLGMKSTVFKNASGLPNTGQVSTATDLAILAIALRRDFPQYYTLFSTDHFIFRGRYIHSHNHVTRTYSGAEGLKTGYTRASGFNLVTVATRNNVTLVGVVIGGETKNARDTKMVRLLDHYFGYSVAHKSKNNTISKLLKSKKSVVKS